VDLNESRTVTKSAVIADDDETIRSILQYKLSKAGFDLTVCHDGEAGREALNDPNIDPDIVILDVMMPRLKGTQLLRIIRRGELAVASDVPVIMLTSRGREADVLEAFESGASEYLTKPFSPNELLVRIEKLIGA
jgi:DNA-binding response OmpR family regulator